MNRFFIEKLVVSGTGHTDSVLKFEPTLNFILGPSNTGKSMIMDCIDYAFGFTPKKDRPSKIVNNNYGYKKVALHLRTLNGTVILEREIGSNKIKVTSSDDAVKDGLYSTSTNAKHDINSVFLQLLGIGEPHKILSSEDGATQQFTWRSILHLFFMKQADIARETSALKAPGAFGKTSSPAALLYLLTGQDADNIKKNEDPEISKAKKKALTDYIREKVLNIAERREELEKELASHGLSNYQETVEQIHKEIDALQKKLDEAISESQTLMTQIYKQNDRLSECNTVIHNFSVLRKQYQSDIQRLGFVVEGKINASPRKSKRHCPLCDSEITIEPDPKYVDAAASELQKIKEHLAELQIAQNDIDKQRQKILTDISTLETKKRAVDSLITEQLQPQLSIFKEQLDSNMTFMRLSGELEIIKQNETQYKSELFAKETEETPANPTYKIAEYYSYDLIKEYEKKLIEILTASNIGGATTARLNMETFDLEIGGRPKAVSMGGGFCGILNTITALAMCKFLLENDCKAPAFFVADSALTQLSEAEHVAQRDTIKQNFIQYLINNALKQQVIIIEQKKSMPFIPAEDKKNGIHIIEFSRNKNFGRYGFLNDVYNPEDN